MADLFHEIEEDLRRDQAMALWNKYGNVAIGAVLLIVLAVAAQWGWTKYTTHQRLQASADFLAAAANADATQREVALAKVVAEGGSYATLARFRLAEAALAGLARVQAALLEMEVGKPEVAADLVKEMMVEGHAYRLAALEVTGLAALAGGDKGKARATFEELKKAAAADGAGSGFERRADQLLDRLKD